MIIDESEARIASMYLIRQCFCTTYFQRRRADRGW